MELVVSLIGTQSLMVNLNLKASFWAGGEITICFSSLTFGSRKVTMKDRHCFGGNLTCKGLGEGVESYKGRSIIHKENTNILLPEQWSW